MEYFSASWGIFVCLFTVFQTKKHVLRNLKGIKSYIVYTHITQGNCVIIKEENQENVRLFGN